MKLLNTFGEILLTFVSRSQRLFLAEENSEVLPTWLLDLFFFSLSCAYKARPVCRIAAIYNFQKLYAIFLPSMLFNGSKCGRDAPEKWRVQDRKV